MAKYLITYIGNGEMPSDPAIVHQMMQAFGAWLQKAGSAVLDPGAPVKTVGQVANGTPEAEIPMGGYSIIEAADIEAVKAILSEHPYLQRGGTLQIGQIAELS